MNRLKSILIQKIYKKNIYLTLNLIYFSLYQFALICQKTETFAGNLMLSDTKIKSLKSKEKAYRVLDAERLYIEVRPTGKKIWRFKYTLKGRNGKFW